MAEDSKIEWTDNTFNPWVGCSKVSAGCAHCYAEELMDQRYGKAKWGPEGTRVVTSESYWKQPLKWNRAAEKDRVRRKVFCASLADVFEDRPELEIPRQRLFDLIQKTTHLDWLLLTKRPEFMAEWMQIFYETWSYGDDSSGNLIPRANDPLPNIWLGTSVENQETANERIPLLLKAPATIRFLSMEPLIGPVDLSQWLFCDRCRDPLTHCGRGSYETPLANAAGGCWFRECYCSQIQWVIVGGESGSSARPMDYSWVAEIQKQCKDAKVPFFFKQWGEWYPAEQSKHIPSNLSPNPSHAKEWMRDEAGRPSFYRFGKKESGRLFNGKLWNESPLRADTARKQKTLEEIQRLRDRISQLEKSL